MATLNSTSKPPRVTRNRPKQPSTASTTAAPPAGSSAPPTTPSARTLEETINHERTVMLQVHAMLHCLHEVLLYTEDDDSALHAEVAYTAAGLINESAQRLDSVIIRPLIDASRGGGGISDDDPRDLSGSAEYETGESVAVYVT